MVILHRGVSLPDGIFSWLDVSIWSGLSHRKIFWSYHPGPSHGWNELENTGSAVEFSIIITFLGIFWDSQYAIWYVQSKYSKWNDTFGRYWKYNWSITHSLRHHRPSPRETLPFFASPHVKEDGGERQNDHPGINPQGVFRKTARDQSWDTNLKMEGKHRKNTLW